MTGRGWRVEIAPAAQRQLRRLPPADAARLRPPILALSIEPRPPGSARNRPGGLDASARRPPDQAAAYRTP